jgi:isoleucyl-tRNA synthetase
MAVKMTLAQMEEASRKATVDGMREIAEAFAKKNNKEQPDSDTTTTTDSDDKNVKYVRKSKENKSNTNSAVEKLESQIHYLRMDLINSKVELDDTRTDVNKYKNISDLYVKINNELGFIRSAIDRSNKNLTDLTIKQFKNKVALFVEEANEHVVLCEQSINKIELHEIKFALERIINAEKKKINRYNNELQDQIWWMEAKKIMLQYTFGFFIIVIVLFLFGYKYIKIENYI